MSVRATLLLLLISGHLLFFPGQTLSQNITEIQQLHASDIPSFSSSEFGHAVAMSGNFLLVGAHFESGDSLGWFTKSAAGAAYMFEKDENGYYQQIAKLVPSDRKEQDEFGYSVAIDGDVALIGAYREEPDTGYYYADVGCVYVYIRQSNGYWKESQKLYASDFSDYYSGMHFGSDIAIDGDFIVVGDDLNRKRVGIFGNGAVYIYKRNLITGKWDEIQKIAGTRGIFSDGCLGSAVDIDGNKVIIGNACRWHLSTTTSDKIGEAAIYKYDVPSGVFILEQLIDGWNNYNTVLLGNGDTYFGQSVAIVGNTVFIGAPEDRHPTTIGLTSGRELGAVFTYTFDAVSGEWKEGQKLHASDYYDEQHFAHELAADGDRFFTSSSPSRFGPPKNAEAYFFEKNASQQWYESGTVDTNIVFDIHEINEVDIEDDYAVIGNFDKNVVYVYHFCEAKEYPETVVACKGDSVLLGGSFQSSVGIYRDTLLNHFGCDSIIASTLELDSLDTALKLKSATLFAPAGAQAYQWVDCRTGMPVPWATNVTFSPAYSGSFKVIIEKDGCIDSSACMAVTSIGIASAEQQYNTIIYPNPANDFIQLKISPLPQDAFMEIIDMSGRKVKEGTRIENTTTSINVSAFPSAQYWLVIRRQGSVLVRLPFAVQ